MSARTLMAESRSRSMNRRQTESKRARSICRGAKEENEVNISVSEFDNVKNHTTKTNPPASLPVARFALHTR